MKRDTSTRDEENDMNASLLAMMLLGRKGHREDRAEGSVLGMEGFGTVVE